MVVSKTASETYFVVFAIDIVFQFVMQCFDAFKQSSLERGKELRWLLQ